MAQEPPTGIDDAELLLRIAVDRDQLALRTFMTRHKDRVYGFLAKRFGEPVADEAFYRAMFQVWQFADRYEPKKGTPGPWFLRIAQNAARSILRGEMRHQHAELEQEPGYDPGDCGPEGDQEFDEASKEKEQVRAKRKKDLLGIIDSLPRLQQAIVRADLADPSGTAPARRLADHLGSSVGSILASRSKARSRIRQEFARLGHHADGKGGRPNAR